MLFNQAVGLAWQAQAFFVAAVRFSEPQLLPTFLRACHVPLVRAWQQHRPHTQQGVLRCVFRRSAGACVRGHVAALTKAVIPVQHSLFAAPSLDCDAYDEQVPAQQPRAQ